MNVAEDVSPIFSCDRYEHDTQVFLDIRTKQKCDNPEFGAEHWKDKRSCPECFDEVFADDLKYGFSDLLYTYTDTNSATLEYKKKLAAAKAVHVWLLLT